MYAENSSIQSWQNSSTVGAVPPVPPLPALAPAPPLPESPAEPPLAGLPAAPPLPPFEPRPSLVPSDEPQAARESEMTVTATSEKRRTIRGIYHPSEPAVLRR